MIRAHTQDDIETAVVLFELRRWYFFWWWCVRKTTGTRSYLSNTYKSKHTDVKVQQVCTTAVLVVWEQI